MGDDGDNGPVGLGGTREEGEDDHHEHRQFEHEDGDGEREGTGESAAEGDGRRPGVGEGDGGRVAVELDRDDGRQGGEEGDDGVDADAGDGDEREGENEDGEDPGGRGGEARPPRREAAPRQFHTERREQVCHGDGEKDRREDVREQGHSAECQEAEQRAEHVPPGERRGVTCDGTGENGFPNRSIR